MAFLLLLLSSGLTIVHHACEMETRLCCAAMQFPGTMDGAKPSHGLALSSVPMSCCRNLVAGGLTTINALIEKQTKTEDQKLDLAPVLCDLSTVSAVRPVSPRFSLPLSEWNDPPPVEKYVLFASLLI